MIQTMIVDSDAHMRGYLEQIIPALCPQFEVKDSADNGLAAWQKIQECAPSVVFLDTELPGMDGLTLLRLCSGLSNPPVCVLVSARADFSAAQQAVQYHAFQYILKPIHPDILKDTLERLAAQMSVSKKLIQQNYFTHLLHNTAPKDSEEDIRSAFENIGCFYTYYVCIGSYCTARDSQFDYFGDFWKKTNFDEIVPTFAAAPDTLWLLHEKNICFFVYATQKKDPQKQEILCEKIMNFLAQFDCPKTFVYNSCTEKKEELRSQFLELDSYGKNFSIFGDSISLNLADNTEVNDADLISFAGWQMLSDLIIERKFDLFQKQTAEILQECEKKRCSQRKLNGITKRICEIANNNYLPYAVMDQIDELISNTTAYADVSTGLHDILANIFHHFPENSYDRKVSAIKDFIDNHYTEPLSLAALSERFSFSISYLSTLFKKHYKVSPSDYITGLRMSRAKILLEGDGKSIREVAEAVGYYDPYYFSRLFKMETGVTPSQYRQEQRK
ncbi:MAG: AraC family transcriptional regulator [Eubacteriales bacterium]|nr:AraC family transcriptional regulator [Eubacteriales bacterium]